MRIVDTAILAALEAAGLDVHDGMVDTTDQLDDQSVRIVNYDLPYVVYYSSVGDDHGARLDGRTSRRAVFFSITYVGIDRNQAKWAGEKVRDAIEGKRLAVPGHKAFLVDLLESQRIRRDDDAIRPDGLPLFYGVDNYAVSITRVRQEASA